MKQRLPVAAAALAMLLYGLTGMAAAEEVARGLSESSEPPTPAAFTATLL